MQSQRQTSRPHPPPPSCPSPPPSHTQGQPHRDEPSLGLDGLSLIDRARALCAVADDVQKATVEASRRIAAIHGSPERPRNTKAAAKKTVKEPPDICARPPSDFPPPRGEGWRRLGPASVVCGSNRISAPPQFRRALTRDKEVFVGDGRYRVVPADIDPGGGFCVSLDRDFAGETNMACMLYIRKKGATHIAAGKPNRLSSSSVAEERLASSPLTKEEYLPTASPAPIAAAPAPFGSVGETAASGGGGGGGGERGGGGGGTTSASPFSAHIEHDLDMFVMSRPEDRGDEGNTAAVREAQRRARHRALSERKRKAANADKKGNALESTKKQSTAAEIQRLKASRRAALARVASQKHKELAQKEEAQRSAEEKRRQMDALAAAKADAMRLVAACRGGSVAAEKRQREREMELVRQAEETAKRERVAAVLAYDEAKADERERQVRKETFRRIQREERRRELTLQRQEDERMERMRLYERGETYTPPVPPAVQSARSFFSISGSVQSVSETVGGWDGGPMTVSSPAGRPNLNKDAKLVERKRRSSRTMKGVAGPNAGHWHQQRPLPPPAAPPAAGAPEVHRRYRRAAAVASTHHGSAADGAEVLSSTSTPGYYVSPLDGVSSASESGMDYGNNSRTIKRDEVRVPVLLSPTLTLTSGSGGGEGGIASATGISIGSGGSGNKPPRRNKIIATPVWKRPAVPLSKPYVPVPRKDDSRFAPS